MSSSVEEALRQAKYNEAVMVTVPGEGDESSREMVLVASLDERSGGIVWNDLLAASSVTNNDDNNSNGKSELDPAIVRHLRTKRWFLPMLNDHRRNELYDVAIGKAAQKAAQRVVSASRRSLVVLDIGTGTGLLAMMAARHCRAALDGLGAKEVAVEVTSVEMAAAMARLARTTIAENGLEGTITVFEGHSSDPAFSLGTPADLCVSELLESGLLAEGWLPAMRDAWDRHLRPDATCVPSRAKVWAEVVRGTNSVAAYRGPSEGSPSGTERLCLSADRRDVLLGGAGGVTVPVKAESLFSPLSEDAPQPDAVRLSEPVLAMEVDLSRPERVPPSTGSRRQRFFQPMAEGTAHGVLFWWELGLEEGVTYSTKAGDHWQDHWQQCLYVFGDDDDACPRLVPGQDVVLEASHDDTRLSFAILPRDESSSEIPSGRDAKQAKLEQGNLTTTNAHITSSRALQLNDVDRSAVLRSAVQQAIQGRPGASLLDLSDFSLLAIMAATSGATTVSSLESSTGGLPMVAARVAQLGNHLPRSATDQEGEPARFQILNAYAESLELSVLHDDPSKAKPRIVVAEPYYAVLEGWHLQEALNLHHLLRGLRGRGILSTASPENSEGDGYTCVPRFADAMGCAVELDGDFAAAYSCLEKDEHGRASIRGFRHEAVDRHGSRYHEFDANFPLNQYRHKRLTAPFRMARIPYETVAGSVGEDFAIRGNGEWTDTAFLQAGTCHALVCWIEYGTHKDEHTGEMVRMSTFRSTHKQAVRMLRAPAKIDDEDVRMGVRFRCRATFGGLGNGEDHDFKFEIKR